MCVISHFPKHANIIYECSCMHQCVHVFMEDMMKVKKFMAATAAATMLASSGFAYAQPEQDSAQTQEGQPESGVTQGGQDAQGEEASTPVTETRVVEIIIQENTEINVNGIQGIVLSDAGVFVFEPFSGEEEDDNLTLSDLVNDPSKFFNGNSGNRSFKAVKDVDGSHITPDNVHLYLEWLTTEQQNRLNGVKSYQTMVETARGELPTNPFNGTKPTDKATELSSIDNMLSQNHSEYNAVMEKTGDRIVPDNMAALYKKFVQERKDQALKYLDMQINEDVGGLRSEVYELQKQAVIDGDSVEFVANQDTISEALDRAKESGQGISDLKFQGDGDNKGYLIIPRADDSTQEPQAQTE